MSKCGGCGGEFRKGSTVTLLDPAAGPGGKRARVCPKCVTRALVVVAPRVGTRTVEKVEKPLEVERLIKQLQSYSKVAQKALVDRPASGQVDFLEGRIAGLEAAIELLKKER